jgi:hypothetical protein
LPKEIRRELNGAVAFWIVLIVVRGLQEKTNEIGKQTLIYAKRRLA